MTLPNYFSIDQQDFIIKRGSWNNLNDICQLVHQLRPKMKVSDSSYRNFLKDKKWFIYVLELQKYHKVIGFDIRYALNSDTLCLHENGVLLEYANASKKFREYVQLESKAEGYKYIDFYVQNYALRDIALFQKMGARINGIQKDRWVNNINGYKSYVHAIYYQASIEDQNGCYLRSVDTSQSQNAFIITEDYGLVSFDILPNKNELYFDKITKSLKIKSLIFPYKYLQLFKSIIKDSKLIMTGFFRRKIETYVVFGNKCETL